jgi:hypothetical protein
MRVVRVPVSRADFSEMFEGFVKWLDRNDRQVDQFETEPGGGGGSVVIKAQFTEDDLAELFRREFRGNYDD